MYALVEIFGLEYGRIMEGLTAGPQDMRFRCTPLRGLIPSISFIMPSDRLQIMTLVIQARWTLITLKDNGRALFSSHPNIRSLVLKIAQLVCYDWRKAMKGRFPLKSRLTAWKVLKAQIIQRNCTMQQDLIHYDHTSSPSPNNIY